MRFSTQQFSGERPKLKPRDIGDSEAQLALDCELTSQGLRAMRVDRFIQQSDEPALTLYHVDGELLTWSKRVHVAESPSGVSERRVYWTGDGEPKQATLRDFRLGKHYRIGIPTPAAPRIGSVSGPASESGSTAVTSLYTVSFVNQWGEEGDMSAPSATFNYRRGQGVEVTNLGRVSQNTTKLEDFDSINAYRLYRLEEGESRFVTEQPLLQTSYTDITSRTLGDVFSTQDFVPPPKDMHGLHVMANGVALGIVGKMIYVSEPGQINVWPHSFPIQSNGVAISSFDNTAVIATEGYPVVASIYDPRNIAPLQLNEREPCVAPFSMVQALGGVMWATPTALFYVGPSGGQSLTKDFMGERDWQDLNPSSIHAAYRDGKYYAFHSGKKALGRCLIIDTREDNSVVRRLSEYADAVHVKQGSNEMFLAKGQNIEQFQGGTERRRFRWRGKENGPGNPIAICHARALSREFIDDRTAEAITSSKAAQAIARARNIAALSARAHIGVVDGYGGAINQDVLGGAGNFVVPGITDQTHALQPLGVAIGNGADVPLPDALQQRTLVVRVFGDEQLVDETEVTSECVYTLEYADRCRRWSVELEGEIDVTQFDMAGSKSEMHDGS